MMLQIVRSRKRRVAGPLVIVNALRSPRRFCSRGGGTTLLKSRENNQSDICGVFHATGNIGFYRALTGC